MMGLSGMEMGALMFALLLVMLALRIHIGIAMLLTGSIGYTVVAGIDPLLNYFK
jgi:C4-dicarboxylate transporter, DctM subunit